MKARERKLKREKEKNEKTTEKSFQLSNLSNSNSESISNKTKKESESIISINQNSNINTPNINNFDSKKNNQKNNNNNQIRRIKTFRKSNSINELHNNNNNDINLLERNYIKEKKKNISGPITQFIDKQYRNIKRKKSKNNLSHYLDIQSDIPKDALFGDFSNSESTNLEEEIYKLSILYNLNINNEKMLLEENTEFFDMRNTIKDLEKKIEDSKKEYEYIVNQNTIRTINENTQIQKLEDLLKKKVNENIETIRKDNKMIIEDVNVLDKKLQVINEVFQKEEYDLFQLIHEIEKTNKKLKMEIHFIDDLKERLKKIKGNEIPKDLKDKIDSILGK